MCCLHDGDVVVNLGSVLLGDALCNPHNVATFLFLEAEVGIEHSKVELVEESIDIEPHLVLKELVLEGLLSGVVAGALKQGSVLLKMISCVQG